VILPSYVKQCKKCDFYLGRERDFIMLLVMGKPNGPLQKKEKKAPSKHLWFGMHHNKLN
jgi:hypothetical protein